MHRHKSLIQHNVVHVGRDASKKLCTQLWVGLQNLGCNNMHAKISRILIVLIPKVQSTISVNLDAHRSRAGHLRYFRLKILYSIQKHKCTAMKIAFFWARTTRTTKVKKIKKLFIENDKNRIFHIREGDLSPHGKINVP